MVWSPGKMVTNDMGKVEVIYNFFASIFTGNIGLQESQASETRRKVWSKEEVPSVDEDQVREHLNWTSKSPSGLMVRIHVC